MAGTDATDLQDVCLELLEAAEQALDTIPGSAPELAGAPERKFVAAGTPVLDCCDQLTVHVGPVVEDPLSPSSAQSGQRARFDARKNQVTLTVTIGRCMDLSALPSPPPVATLEADAEQHNADGWALWNEMWNLVRSGELFTLCADSKPALRPLAPSGGCSGWTLTYQVWIEGYESP